MQKTHFKTSKPAFHRSAEACLRRFIKKLSGATFAARRAGVLCLLLFGSAASARADVITFPNQISGIIEWNNSFGGLGTVYDYLNNYNAPPTYRLGMAYAAIFANQVPSGFTSTTYPAAVAPTTSTTYEISVEGGDPNDPPNPVLKYDVTPVMQAVNGNIYHFATAHSVNVPPASASTTPVPLDFSECAGLIYLELCDAANLPVTVSFGRLTANIANVTQAYVSFPSSSSWLLPVRADNTFSLGVSIGMTYGTDSFLDLINLTYTGTYTDTVACDQIVTNKFIVPPSPLGSGGSGLGTIIGIVDMLRENEHWLHHDFTKVRADDGPLGNYRLAAVVPPSGCSPVSPFVGQADPCNSAGPFSLVNLLPSNFGGGQKGYRFQGDMIFGLGRRFERFQTPYLVEGIGGLGRFGTLLPNTTMNLGNTCVMDPGYVVGTIRMCSPDEGTNANSLLRYLLRASDTDSNGDQIPDSTHYENETANVWARGLNILSTGGTDAGSAQTADGGLAQTEFAGDFVTSGADQNHFVGDYRLVLGGLFQQTTHWDQSGFVLRFYNTGVPFINSLIAINNQHYQDVTIVPTETITNNHHYGMSKVTVTFHSSGMLFDPTVTGPGNYSTLNDFEGNAAQYTVYLVKGAGKPIGIGAAEHDGEVVLCLPAGTYTMNPTVETVNTGGGSSHNTLTPFTLVVPPCSDIKANPCIQMTVTNLPECSTTNVLHVSGSVSNSCAPVTNISYVLNGTTVNVCDNCGNNPSFAFDITLSDCANTLKIIARDADGNEASVEKNINYDVTPPVLSGCQNIFAPGLNGAVVNYTVTALDNCDGAVAVNCLPPPGLFPPGQTVVTCTAVDYCGNSNTCQFTVTVTNPCPDFVVNGSFETTSPAVAPNTAAYNLNPTTGVPGWATASQSLEIWGNTFAGIPASQGTNHLEINAQSDNQTVTQVVTGLSTNCPATFCFDYTGRFGLVSNTYNNDFTVTLSGGASFSLPLDPATWAVGGWKSFCTNFVPTSSTITIAFHGQPHYSDGTDATQGGAHIDNVSLTQCCPTNSVGTNCPDLWVNFTATYPGPKLHHITGATTPCCGKNFIYHINYGNKGNVPVTGATIKFLYPTACSIVSITQPSGCSAIPSPFTPNTTGSCDPPFFPSSGLPEIFTLPTLNPGYQCSINVEVHLCCDILAACTNQTKLVAQATILPLLPNDCNTKNNHWGHSRRPCCSYDPNDCTVSPTGCGPEGFIHRDQELTYLIQFQNEGGGTAHEVGVQNFLDPDLDVSTLEVLGSSHPYLFERNGRELLWIFHNIELPSQTVDEKASHGFVKFLIRPRTDAAVGTVFTNSAAIYFDSNDPVITITTTNTVTDAPVPIAAFTVVPHHGSAGHTNDFHYTGGTPGAQYQWYFGPDAIPQTSTNSSPTNVIFTTSGPHLVELETSLGDCVAEPAIQLVTVGRPTLDIVKTATELGLYWPGDGFVVQEAVSLTPPVEWQTIQAPTSFVGGWYLVNVPISSTGARFYRLTEAP